MYLFNNSAFSLLNDVLSTERWHGVHYMTRLSDSYLCWGCVALLFLSIIILGMLYKFSYRKYPVLPNGIVLITGCSSGIGLYTAEYIARHCPYVVYATVRKDSDIEKLQACHCKNLRIVKLDVTDEENCQRVIAEIQEHMESEQLPFVALINNAAINAPFPVEFHPMTHANKLFATNFFGCLRLIQLTLPLLRASHGRIINLSSFITSFPVPKGGLYTASKCALDGLSDSLRRELSPFDISISVIEPGMVFSQMNRKNEEIADHILELPQSFESLPEAQHVAHEHTRRHERVAVDPHEIGEEVSHRMKEIYSYLYSAEERHRFQRVVSKSDSPHCVAKAIVHAIISPYPRTRYYVANYDGISIKMYSWFLWILNDRLKDAIVYFPKKKQQQQQPVHHVPLNSSDGLGTDKKND
jgi:NAD(P)-dependent dehydrogenase (short-subunit alcohol dehydrogenase family)